MNSAPKAKIKITDRGIDTDKPSRLNLLTLPSFISQDLKKIFPTDVF